MLVIRDRYGAQLRVAPPMQTQHAITQDDRATVWATASGSTPSETAPVLELRAQQHAATRTQLGSVIAQQTTQGRQLEVADRQLSTPSDELLLMEARRILGWRDIDCQDWLTHDVTRKPEWARAALRECIDLVLRLGGGN